jgi:fluoroquinolone transport system permease protein
MRMSRVFKALGPIDLRNVRRDPLLGWIVAMPLLVALLLRLAIPPLTTTLRAQLGFDLTPFYPVILSYFVIMMLPLIVGMVIGFLLLDERDDGTLTALQVTPLALPSYLAYRVLVPMGITIALLFVAFPLAGLGTLNFGHIFISALVAAPLAPLIALTLAALAQNKVQGFAVLKGLGGALSAPPVLGYFVRSTWHWAFGLFPTFWPMKVYWVLDAGEPNAWLFVAIGLTYQGLLLALLMRRFDQVMHR